MKIAILINTSWNIYNFRKGLVVKLLADGHEVMAIAPKDDYAAKLEKLGCTFHHVSISPTGLNPVKDLRFYNQLKGILSKHRPDAMLTYTIKPNIYGTLAARNYGIPVIANVSGLGTVFLWKGLKRRLAAELYGFALRRCQWVFFQNAEDRLEFSDTVKLNMQKTGLVPGSGVDTTFFQPYDQPNNQVPQFLMVARLIIDKGVREFARAAELINAHGHRANFTLIGELDPSHSRSILPSELENWRSRRILNYLKPTEDIRDILRACDVMVLPSYREGTPRTLLEGGAMAKPLIASDVPGCNNVVVHGENGFLCQVKDATDLAAKMEMMLAMTEGELQIMSKKSRDIIVEKFEENKVIQEYLAKIGALTDNS
ncbi:MAG: glycosyltransferase family 4 protein [Cyclobacteriaceae bacterium]